MDIVPTTSTLNTEAIALEIANPQAFADIGAMLLPKQFQEVGGFVIHQAVSHFFTEVLGIALGQGANFNAQGIVLAQIKKEIEELNKKVDKILNQPLKSSVNALKHAVNYIENKDFYQQNLFSHQSYWLQWT